MLRRVLLLTLLAALLAPAAVASPRAARTTTVGVRMTEFKFVLTKSAVPRGLLVFKLVNTGTVPHDFKIKGKRSAKIRPGKRGTLRVTFTKPGKYRYVCTLPGHAAAGMKGVLRVR
jgi:plastocyanin